MSIFDKYFPIIGKVIDSELLKNDSVHRDTIVDSLLELPEINVLLSNSLEKNKKHNTPKKAVGNMVDWFSAEITKQSKVALPWVNKYIRKKISHKGRKIWEYSFSEEALPNEIIDKNSLKLSEGSIKQITVNAYERNPKARTECIAHYGPTCICCGFNFFEIYGKIGQNFIHVHHLTSFSEIKKEYHVNPITDLRPVCPNCHSMIHRRNPPFTIEEIKKMIEKNAQQAVSPDS